MSQHANVIKVRKYRPKIIYIILSIYFFAFTINKPALAQGSTTNNCAQHNERAHTFETQATANNTTLPATNDLHSCLQGLVPPQQLGDWNNADQLEATLSAMGQTLGVLEQWSTLYQNQVHGAHTGSRDRVFAWLADAIGFLAQRAIPTELRHTQNKLLEAFRAYGEGRTAPMANLMVSACHRMRYVGCLQRDYQAQATSRALVAGAGVGAVGFAAGAYGAACGALASAGQLATRAFFALTQSPVATAAAGSVLAHLGLIGAAARPQAATSPTPQVRTVTVEPISNQYTIALAQARMARVVAPWLAAWQQPGRTPQTLYPPMPQGLMAAKIALDGARQTPPLTQAQIRNYQELWQSAVQSWRRQLDALPPETTTAQRQRLLANMVISDFLRVYHRDTPSPLGSFAGAGSNCVGRAFFLTAAMAELGVPQDNLRVRVFRDHIELEEAQTGPPAALRAFMSGATTPYQGALYHPMSPIIEDLQNQQLFAQVHLENLRYPAPTLNTGSSLPRITLQLQNNDQTVRLQAEGNFASGEIPLRSYSAPPPTDNTPTTAFVPRALTGADPSSSGHPWPGDTVAFNQLTQADCEEAFSAEMARRIIELVHARGVEHLWPPPTLDCFRPAYYRSRSVDRFLAVILDAIAEYLERPENQRLMTWDGLRDLPLQEAVRLNFIFATIFGDGDARAVKHPRIRRLLTPLLGQLQQLLANDTQTIFADLRQVRSINVLFYLDYFLRIVSGRTSVALGLNWPGAVPNHLNPVGARFFRFTLLEMTTPNHFQRITDPNPVEFTLVPSNTPRLGDAGQIAPIVTVPRSEESANAGGPTVAQHSTVTTRLIFINLNQVPNPQLQGLIENWPSAINDALPNHLRNEASERILDMCGQPQFFSSCRAALTNQNSNLWELFFQRSPLTPEGYIDYLEESLVAGNSNQRTILQLIRQRRAESLNSPTPPTAPTPTAAPPSGATRPSTAPSPARPTSPGTGPQTAPAAVRTTPIVPSPDAPPPGTEQRARRYYYLQGGG